ncbi:MAG: efflux RND transporter permease subunit, partial [Bacteroidota bacterium]
MKGLIAYFIKYPIASNLLMTAIFVFGIYGLLNMSSTFFPESESKYISIQSVYLGASPEEIEEGVVTKIEENVRGLTGVERVTSTSSENLGSVSVEVARGYDIDLILTDVKNSVDRINSFPAAMEPPTIYKRENINLVISFALSGDVDLKTLKRFGRDVEDELLAMEGISKISLRGYPEEEIEIAFREQDLINYQITFAQAAQAVRAANLEITGGTIEGDKEDLLIRANNKNYYANDLRDIVVINAPNTGVVRLHQIADIRDQWKDDPTRSYMNGEQAVILEVSNTLEESALDIAADVMAYLDDFNEKNDVVKATIVRDETLYLKQRLALLTENGLMGFGIVLVLLACFLHWR